MKRLTHILKPAYRLDKIQANKKRAGVLEPLKS
jgi:hypothetical protein